MGAETERFSKLVNSIYDAALDNSRWKARCAALP